MTFVAIRGTILGSVLALVAAVVPVTADTLDPAWDPSGGAWADMPAGGNPGTPTDPLGTVTYGVNLPSAGTWYVRLRR